MRGPNKLPSGTYPKAVSKALYPYNITAAVSYEQKKNINEYTKANNCSKGIVLKINLPV